MNTARTWGGIIFQQHLREKSSFRTQEKWTFTECSPRSLACLRLSSDNLTTAYLKIWNLLWGSMQMSVNHVIQPFSRCHWDRTVHQMLTIKDTSQYTPSKIWLPHPIYLVVIVQYCRWVAHNLSTKNIPTTLLIRVKDLTNELGFEWSAQMVDNEFLSQKAASCFSKFKIKAHAVRR